MPLTAKIGKNVYRGGTIDGAQCGHLIIGDYVVLGTNSKLIFHGPVRPWKHDRIEIGDFTYVGDSAIILLGTVIGRCSIVGAGSVVCGGTFPPYSTLVGNPARSDGRRAAIEILRTWTLKYGTPNPRVLGEELEPEWERLTSDAIRFLLGSPPYDAFAERAIIEGIPPLVVVKHYQESGTE